jgi:hypothetical protein
MNEEKKEDMQEVSIFSLYTREKIITHIDDQKQKTVILLVKMNQRERKSALDAYFNFKVEEENRLREDEKKNNTQSKVINLATKDQLITEILDYEKTQRARFAHLYPFENEVKLSDKEKKEKIKELSDEWEKERKAALNQEKIEELQKTLLEYTLEGLSVIEAGRIYDYAALSFMCRHPRSKEKIFKDYKQVEEVLDRRVLDWLIEELRKFQKLEFSTEKEQIKEAKSESFFTNGGSPKQSGGNPPLKN